MRWGSILHAKQNYYRQRLDCSLATSDCNSNAKLVYRAGSWNAKSCGKEEMLLLACCVRVYWLLFLPTSGNSWFWSLHVNPADCEPFLPSCSQGLKHCLAMVLKWQDYAKMKGEFLEKFHKGCSDEGGCCLAYKSLLIIKRISPFRGMCSIITLLL